MLLRNKKTGEIIDLGKGSITDAYLGTSIQLQAIDRYNKPIWNYNSLAELNEEWEDYEEPKAHWYIYGAEPFEVDEDNLDKDFVEEIKSIGNYFETKDEAEKAVEKLKAWKRLKDKGAEFYGWRRNQTGTYELYLRWEDRIPRSYEVKNDLDLLFGGEE